MNDIYILSSARTAIGNFGGCLSNTPPEELGSIVITECLKRAEISAKEVDEVLLGCVLQAGRGQNVARQAAIKADVPVGTTATTINMVCGSGLRSIVDAARLVSLGDARLIVAGGTENMSLAPYFLEKARYGYRMGSGEIKDSMVYDGLWDIFNNYHMGITAENIAELYNITRVEQDEFAAESQNRAEVAINEGKFEEEIVAVSIPKRKGDPIVFKQDEFPRFGTTKEILGKLKPAFKKDGTVTAGNSSGINDGAACVLVGSKDCIKKVNTENLFRVVSWGYAGIDPSVMGLGSIEAVKIAMGRAGWASQDLDLVEANEAFAAQTIAVNKEVGWNSDIVNVNGGAIALGHPIGASGARILVTLIHEMKKRKSKRGLAALCIGGGMGIALCIESVKV